MICYYDIDKNGTSLVWINVDYYNSEGCPNEITLVLYTHYPKKINVSLTYTYTYEQDSRVLYRKNNNYDQALYNAYSYFSTDIPIYHYLSRIVNCVTIQQVLKIEKRTTCKNSRERDCMDLKYLPAFTNMIRNFNRDTLIRLLKNDLGLIDVYIYIVEYMEEDKIERDERTVNMFLYLINN